MTSSVILFRFVFSDQRPKPQSRGVKFSSRVSHFQSSSPGCLGWISGKIIFRWSDVLLLVFFKVIFQTFCFSLLLPRIFHSPVKFVDKLLRKTYTDRSARGIGWRDQLTKFESLRHVKGIVKHHVNRHPFNLILYNIH